MYSRPEAKALKLAVELLQQLAAKSPLALDQAVRAIGSDDDKFELALDQLTAMNESAQETYRVV